MATPTRRPSGGGSGSGSGGGNAGRNALQKTPSTPKQPPNPNPKDYVLVEVIGRGSFGTVYKAHKKGQTKAVAIKVMRLTGLSPTQKDNLITEITILKRVKNRYMVQLLDFLWDDYYIYLIFEYCAGGELSQFIRASRIINEKVAQHFLQQIAIALRELRTHKIAHMDLKPQNILLSRPLSSAQTSFRNVVLKVVDFGLSQMLRTREEESSDGELGTSFRGSPLYMAPEIFSRVPYDARVDLWSVGIILYECLFGQPPFKSPTRSGLIEKITDLRPIRIPPIGCGHIKISCKCRDLLVRLLQRDPAHRLSFEEFFTHPFIDLEHAPTPESYMKGVRLIADAVLADKAGQQRNAFQLYQDGLLYLVPVYQWGDGENVSSDRKAEELKRKLLHYMDRAEQIKRQLLEDPNAFWERDEVVRGFDLLSQADDLVEADAFREALSLYNDAFELLIPAVSRFRGADKESVHAELSRAMSRAEEAKDALKRREKEKQIEMQMNALVNGTMNMRLRSGKELNPAYNNNDITVPNGMATIAAAKLKARELKDKAAKNGGTVLVTKKDKGPRATKLPTSDFVLRTFHLKDSINNNNPCNVQ